MRPENICFGVVVLLLIMHGHQSKTAPLTESNEVDHHGRISNLQLFTQVHPKMPK